MITHLVCFQFRDPAADLDRAAAMLESLPPKVPQIRHYEVGRDMVGSERSYHLALVSTFESLDDLRSYQAHLDHVEVATFLREACSHMVTVDYES